APAHARVVPHDRRPGRNRGAGRRLATASPCAPVACAVLGAFGAACGVERLESAPTASRRITAKALPAALAHRRATSAPAARAPGGPYSWRSFAVATPPPGGGACGAAAPHHLDLERDVAGGGDNAAADRVDAEGGECGGAPWRTI